MNKLIDWLDEKISETDFILYGPGYTDRNLAQQMRVFKKIKQKVMEMVKDTKTEGLTEELIKWLDNEIADLYTLYKVDYMDETLIQQQIILKSVKRKIMQLEVLG